MPTSFQWRVKALVIGSVTLSFLALTFLWTQHSQSVTGQQQQAVSIYQLEMVDHFVAQHFQRIQRAMSSGASVKRLLKSEGLSGAVQVQKQEGKEAWRVKWAPGSLGDVSRAQVKSYIQSLPKEFSKSPWGVLSESTQTYRVSLEEGKHWIFMFPAEYLVQLIHQVAPLENVSLFYRKGDALLQLGDALGRLPEEALAKTQGEFSANGNQYTFVFSPKNQIFWVQQKASLGTPWMQWLLGFLVTFCLLAAGFYWLHSMMLSLFDRMERLTDALVSDEKLSQPLVVIDNDEFSMVEEAYNLLQKEERSSATQSAARVVEEFIPAPVEKTPKTVIDIDELRPLAISAIGHLHDENKEQTKEDLRQLRRLLDHSEAKKQSKVFSPQIQEGFEGEAQVEVRRPQKGKDEDQLR